MALSTATITFDLADWVGADLDARRTRGWITTNAPEGYVADTDAGLIRVDDAKVTVADDGTGSVTLWVPGVDANPATWQTTFHFDVPRNGRRDRKTLTMGPFTITTSADLASLIEEQIAIPTATASDYATAAGSSATDAASSASAAATSATNAEGSATSADADRIAAEAARDAAVDISNISTSDAVVEALVKNTGGAGPLTSAALTASIADKVTPVHQETNASPDVTHVTILSGMDGEAVNGWAASNCAVDIDTGHTIIGGRALRLTMSAAVAATVTVNPPGIDGVSLKHPPAQAVGQWVWIEDVTKVSAFNVYLYNSADFAVGSRWSVNVSGAALGKLKNGWNLMRWPASQSSRGTWTEVFKVEWQVVTTAATTVTLGHLWLECPAKAKVIITCDGWYNTFETAIGAPIRNMGGNIQWAGTPVKAGLTGSMTVAQLQAKQALGDSVSFHGYDDTAVEPTTSATPSQLRTWTARAQRWCQSNGFTGWVLRGAWLGNRADNGAAIKNLVAASATYGFHYDLTCWPPIDRLDIPRIPIQGTTSTDIDTYFTKLQQTRQTAWFYTHEVLTDRGGVVANATPEEVSYWLAKVQAGVDAGWLEVVTVEQLLARSGAKWKFMAGGPVYEFLDSTNTPKSIGNALAITVTADSWVPTNLGSLLAWYDPTKTNLADGAALTSWVDSSDYGNHLTTVVGAPTYAATGINGRPAIDFNGASSLSLSAFAGGAIGSGAITVAFNLQADVLISKTLFGTQTSGAAAAAEFYYNSSGNRVMRRATDVADGAADTSVHTVILTFNGASSTMEVDGTVVVTGNPSNLSPANLFLGQRPGATNYWDGKIGDFAMFNAALATSDLNALRTWLGARRGVVL